jgi:citrate synthase
VTLDLLRAGLNQEPIWALEAGVVGLTLDESIAGSFHDQAVRLLVGLPLVVAAFDRLRRELPPANPQPRASIAAHFLAAWRGEEPAMAEIDALDRGFVLVADHELNAATFAARVAASTGADLRAAILAALATHGGPLHGGNARKTGDLLNATTPEDAALDVARRLGQGERVPGFVHSVYRRGDPRVPFFRTLAADLAELTGDRRHLDVADRVAAIMSERTGLLPNMDLYAAVCWCSLGIPADLFPAIFALGRVAGWVAHILEQSADNRLIRPRARYVGPTGQHYVPIEERR